jgi:ribonuclease D
MTRQWHDDIGFLLEALHQIETAYADLQRSEAVWREMVSDHAVASRLRPLQPLVGWRETIARQKRDVARETFDTLMGEFMSGEVYAAIAAYTSLAGDG